MKFNSFAYFAIVVLGTMLFSLNACKKPFTSIKSVEIENKVTHAFENELTIVKSKKVDYNIRIHTNPDNSLLFYAINNEGAIKLKDYWIKVDSNVKFLNFYTSSNKPTTENYRLYFSDGEEELINASVFPNPTNDLLTISILGQNRGDIQIEVLKVTGKRIINNWYFKNDDVFEAVISLGAQENGIYFVLVSYGDTRKTYRIAKS